MTDENDKAPRDLTDEELQDESAWDFESAQQMAPAERKARAVVSVAFPGEAFDYVSEAAEGAGMKISHFIREAAIEKAAAATVYFGVDATKTAAYNSMPEETQGFVTVDRQSPLELIRQFL